MMQTSNARVHDAPCIPRMLTIREEAKAGPLSEYTLRLMLKQGRLPGVYVGGGARKFLVNHDRLCDMLNGSAEV